MDENGEIRRPEFSEYEFLTNSPSPFSTFPSKPAKQKNLEKNLDSCQMSQLVSEGLVFWPYVEGRRLFSTLDEVKEEGVAAGRRCGGRQSEEEAVELMLTSR